MSVYYEYTSEMSLSKRFPVFGRGPKGKIRFYGRLIRYGLLRPDCFVPRDIDLEPVGVLWHCGVAERPGAVILPFEAACGLAFRQVDEDCIGFSESRGLVHCRAFGEGEPEGLHGLLRQHALHDHERLVPRVHDYFLGAGAEGCREQ